MLTWFFVGLAVLLVIITVLSLKLGFVPTSTQSSLGNSSGLDVRVGEDHLRETVVSAEYGKQYLRSRTYDYSMETIVSAWFSGKARNVVAVLGLLGGFWGFNFCFAGALISVGELPFILSGLSVIALVVYGSKPFVSGFIEEYKRQKSRKA